jgi:hypothetical protein
VSKEIKPGLSTVELEKLTVKLASLEEHTEEETGVRKISGGFAEATMFDFDDDFIDVELEWGVQSDCENVIHTEQWKLNRKTFEWED